MGMAIESAPPWVVSDNRVRVMGERVLKYALVHGESFIAVPS